CARNFDYDGAWFAYW
nr:immunoglobulin heavy chain junction region [Mus musculus]